MRRASTRLRAVGESLDTVVAGVILEELEGTAEVNYTPAVSNCFRRLGNGETQT